MILIGLFVLNNKRTIGRVGKAIVLGWFSGKLGVGFSMAGPEVNGLKGNITLTTPKELFTVNEYSRLMIQGNDSYKTEIYKILMTSDKLLHRYDNALPHSYL